MTSVVRRHDDSGDYSDGSQDIEHNNSGNDAGQPESDYDSQGSDSERSDVDPDSQEAERRVDDDEDRSNPQYIPKRGTFYEHDDRTAASGEESTNTTSELSAEKKEGSETASERRRPPRKSDIINKWSHDKYNENEQMPKSREELVAIYGYDIRNEDAPPHARRNRRYGRGPNKYTRTWEDEEAYKRQTAAQAQPRKPPNPEDFPQLDAPGSRISRKPRTVRPRSKSQPNRSNESIGPENGTELRRNASIKKPAVKPTSVKNAPVKSPVKPAPEERRRVEEKKMPPVENLTITANVGNSQGQVQRKVNASVAQQRPVPTEMAKRRPQPAQQPQPPSNLPQNKPQSQQQPPPQQQKQQPPQQQPPPQAGAEPRGGSKRYSSLRQRPLAENYAPQQPPQQQQPPPQQQQQPPPQLQQPPMQQQPQLQQQQQHRYNAGGGGEFPGQHAGSPAPAHPQHIIQQMRTPHGASPPHPPPQHAPHPPQPNQVPQQVRLGIMEQQQMVSHAHHTLHNIPPQQHAMVSGQLQPSQGYAPPAMMPAQYMQSGSGGVYGAAPIYAPASTPYQHPPIYPHHNYPQATSAGGVTYFHCAEQEPPPRTLRRPTAAIPIVKPMPAERAANSTEKDNIDRIVENMFVRKPWPAPSDSKEKSQSESRSSEPRDLSQPNSLTSSTISTDSKPSECREEKPEEVSEETQPQPSQPQPSQPQPSQPQPSEPQPSQPQPSQPQPSQPQPSQPQLSQAQPNQVVQPQESISTDA